MKTNFILFVLLITGFYSVKAQSLVCFNDINASLDSVGEFHMSSDIVIESTMGQIDSIVVSPSLYTCDDLGTNVYLAEAYFGGIVVTSCTGNIIIEDKLAPIAIGDISVNVTLDSNGEYHFSPGDIDDGSYDNCGIDSYTYSPSMVNCSSASPTMVLMTVSDESGNSNQVMSEVYIDYNTATTLACTGELMINVIGGPVEVLPEDVLEGGPYACFNNFFNECTDSDGNVVSCTFDETQVSDIFIVTVTDFASGMSCWSEITIISQGQPYGICVEDFEGGDVKDVEIMTNLVTGDDGCVDITSGPGFQITPVLADDQLNGVDDIDLMLMRENILGIIPFKAEQLLAADISNIDNSSVGSGLTTLDLVLLQKAMMGEYTFEKSWVFIDSEYDFQDNVMPSNFNEYITIGTESNYTFRGIKYGDVDLSYEQFVSDDDKVSLKAADIVLNAGEFYNIPVRASELVNLVVANVQFPSETAEYRVVNITSKIESYSFDPELDIANNIARFRWLGNENEAKTGGVHFEEDEALFTIEIEALENGILSHTFDLADVTGANKWKESLALQGTSLKLEYTNLITVPTIETVFEDMFISPNPANEYIHISNVTSSDQNELSYIVTDIMGKTVLQGTLSDNNNITISDLSKGIYMLQVIDNGVYGAPKKFIKQL